MVDSRNTDEQRREIAKAFRDAARCCLDEGFSERLRKMASSIDALMSHDVVDMLLHAFGRALLSTQFVECLFAALRSWIIAARKMSAPGLARKHAPIYGAPPGRVLEAFGAWSSATKSCYGQGPPCVDTRQKKTKPEAGAFAFRSAYLSTAAAEDKREGVPYDRTKHMTEAARAWKARPSVPHSESELFLHIELDTPLQQFSKSLATSEGAVD